MHASGAKAVSGAFAKDRALDTALNSIGVSAALVSASFAGYMVVVGPGPGGGRAEPPPAAAVPPPPHVFPAVNAQAPAQEAPAKEFLADGIDFTPTGSIADAGASADRKAPTTEARILNDFAVRDVFDGTALVEAHGTLQMVNTGATVAGAGRVLGIERSNGVWIVRTAGGTIRQRR